MSSPQPKVNPPLCDSCMSSSDVMQNPDGSWHCFKERCLCRHRWKPIMITSIDKNEPVSSGLFNRLINFLTRDLAEDRRPKHPRPALVPRPQVSRPKPPQLNPPRRITEGRPEIDVGRPPRGGSGALPAPPPDCPYCEVGRVEHLTKGDIVFVERFHCVACEKDFTMKDVPAPKSSGRPFQSGRDDLTEPSSVTCPECSSIKVQLVLLRGAHEEFTIEKYVCKACLHKFTYEDVMRAEGISITTKPKVEHKPLSTVIEFEEIASVDELLSTECEGEKVFVPRPPKTPTSEDRVRPRIEGESIETDLRSGLRPNGQDAENELLSATEEKDRDRLPTEKSWSKSKTEPAPETSSAWWTAIKWTIGVGASIGLGWIAEWAFF